MIAIFRIVGWKLGNLRFPRVVATGTNYYVHRHGRTVASDKPRCGGALVLWTDLFELPGSRRR